ncbi:MFS transporter [Streptomyces sp. NPDC015346]|uniref:MFS transporter n=1 Tax=Streptomyces sp. NPDC015346 TaxID=3364954 RepID=UPI0037012846
MSGVLQPVSLRACAAAVVCLGLFMLGMDLTVLNVAVPAVQREVGASTAQVQWIVDGYALVLGGSVLAVGAFTDAWGRRRSFVSGVSVCAVASVFGALASAPWQIIAARCAMGAGAALLMPATLAVIHDLFPEPHLRRRAIAVWAAVGGLGGLSGPVIGGWLVEQFSWRAGFWVNLPLAVVTVVLAAAVVPESRCPRRDGRFDVLGAVLSASSLLTLVWAIIESPHRGWLSTATLTGYGVAVVLMAAFVVHQWRARAPMLPLYLLGVPRIGLCAASLALMSFAMFGALYVLTLYLQGVLGYSPWEAGVRTLPLPVGLAAGAGIAVPVVTRWSEKVPIVVGLLIVAAGFTVLAGSDPASGYTRSAVFQLITGVGSGMVAAAATEAVMGAVPSQRAGLGSAVNDATRQIGSALGVAVQGSVLAAGFTSHVTASLQQAGTHVPALIAEGGLATLPAYAARLDEPGRSVVMGAARSAFIDAMTMTAIVAGVIVLVAAAVAAWGLPGHRERERSGALPPVHRWT